MRSINGKVFTIGSILAVLTAGALHAQSPVPAVQTNADTTGEPGGRSIAVARIEKAPVIDGLVDDQVWTGASKITEFYQTAPGDRVQPSNLTEVLIAYDNENLYFAFRCFDTPGGIRASVAKRDNILADDNVRVYLDTYNDQRRAYMIAFNPLGIQQDGIYLEGQTTPDYTVDVVMESKGIIAADGYTVEVKVPFRSLRYSGGKQEIWGFNVVRTIVRNNNETIEWVPRSRERSGFLSQHGKLSGLDGIERRRTLEVIPSVTFSQTGTRIVGNRFVTPPAKPELGVNLKYSITPNITLDAAINPDFAEVEADAPVVTANQRFPIFFPEKRPFFLEGADIFQTPLRLFNSRAIFDPDFAAKVTGKVGRQTFGLLASIDNKRAAENKSYAGVVRYKRDLGRENSLGAIATTNHFPGRHNSVGGVDGRFRFDEKQTFLFQIAATNAQANFFDHDLNRSDYRTGNGVGFYFRYDLTGRNRGVLIEGEGRSPDYRADIGFSQRLNTNAFRLRFRLASEPVPERPLIRAEWFNQTGYRIDWKGRLQATYHNTNANFYFQRNTLLHVESFLAYENLYEDEFGARRTATNPDQGAFFGDPKRSSLNGVFSTFFRTAPSKMLSGEIFFGHNWGTLDLDGGNGFKFPRVSPAALANPSAKRDPGKGNTITYGGLIDYKPTKPLLIRFSYEHTALRRYDTGLLVFRSNLFVWRTEYQFSTSLFARSRWDYDTLTERINGQLLFGWNPNPGTAIYLGYNDSLRHNGFNQFMNGVVQGFERDGRTVFLRASYLFRKSL